MGTPKSADQSKSAKVRCYCNRAFHFAYIFALAVAVSVVHVDIRVTSLPDARPDMRNQMFRLGISSAAAGDRNSNDSREMFKQQEREARRQQKEAEQAARRMEKQQREAEQRAAEQQREAQRRAAEQQREAQRRAAEQQRLQAQQSQKAQASSSQKASQPIATEKVGNAAPSEQLVTRSGSSSTTDSANQNSKANAADRTAKAEDKYEKSVPVIVDTGPPPTVEKWLKQLAAPNEKPVAPVVPMPNVTAPKTMPAVVAAPTQAAKAVVPVNSTKSPSAAMAKSTATGGRPEPIAFPEMRLPAVLAVNASPSTVARAKALGFKTSAPTSLASLNFAVTRFVAPAGMSALAAQDLLTRNIPDGTFSPNQNYVIYRTANGQWSEPDGTPVGARIDAGSCGEGRCFAGDVIGWRPELRSCATGIKIGIIDTSVDVTHPTFAGRKIDVRHFGKTGTPGPNWHGTGVTALLAGGSESETPGLIPDASFYIADIFYAGEDREPASDTLSMLRAFDWLETKGVKIINMSLSGPPDALIETAIAKLASKGILLVAAAGNDGPKAGPSYPAAYEPVIAVTAVNNKLQNYRYANRGAYIDIAAPGVEIWTALPGSKQGYHSGTSFATPYVTASLAAIYPELASKTSHDALHQIQFRDLGEPGNDPVYGRGLLVAPVSCSDRHIAKTPGNKTPGRTIPSASAEAQNPTASSIGLLHPSAGPAEELPWLSLQGGNN